MIPRGKRFGRLRTDGWCNGCCRKWVWEHSNGDPAYPWVEPPSNPLCQQSKFTILDSTLQNPNPLTQTLIPLSSSLNWTSKPLSSHSTYNLQITLTLLRTSTIHLYVQVFFTLRNPIPVQAGSHYDLFPVIIFMTILFTSPVLLFLSPLSLVVIIIYTCWRAHSVPLWALST